MFVSSAHAAGVIDDAPRLAVVLNSILNFLLSVFGLVAILAAGVAAFLYFSAAGDQKQLAQVKKIVTAIVVGVVIALASLVVLKQIIALI